MRVKRSSPLIDWVDHQGAGTDVLSNHARSSHCIKQQIMTKALFLIAHIHAKHTEQNDRNLHRRVSREPSRYL